jgi:histidyl-tRNA synthetase
MVRDFEYYTGPVFRFELADGWDVGGGGRYDALVRSTRGATPACGFALNVDRLLERLPESAAVAAGSVIEVEPATQDPKALGLALAVALELQDKGFCAELVASRRPATRWCMTVDPQGGARRYVIRQMPDGPETAGASMEDIVGVLGRARC